MFCPCVSIAKENCLIRRNTMSMKIGLSIKTTTNMTMMIPTPMTTLMRTNRPMTNRSTMMIVTQTLMTLKKTSWSISQIAANAITVPLVAR